ncbi:MAG: HU family DNA-binding protein [Acidimicrobiia bacterium]|nr:HU family DNA-binding protein [Acidimicrobiia bacterium]
MNKSELVAAVAARAEQSQKDVDDTVAAFFEVVAEAIAKGEKVTIPGWISFEQTDRAARTGRNPATGETLQIPASKAAKVSAGSKLKAAAKG